MILDTRILAQMNKMAVLLMILVFGGHQLNAQKYEALINYGSK